MASDPSPDDDPDDSGPGPSRWGLPLVIGLAVGGLVGGLAVFATMRMSASRDQSVTFVAEQFDFQQVLANSPGIDGIPSSGETAPLGREVDGVPEKTAVRRRITFNGTVRPGVAPNEWGNVFRDQVEAELNRHGARTTGGGTSTTWSGNEYRFSWDAGYVTRDGRRGRLDVQVDLRNGLAWAVLLLTEGR